MNAQTHLLETFSTSNPSHLEKPRRILRLPDVLGRTGLSRSGLYERIKAGGFPAPVSLGGRSVGWMETDIDVWICRRAGARPS